MITNVHILPCIQNNTCGLFSGDTVFLDSKLQHHYRRLTFIVLRLKVHFTYFRHIMVYYSIQYVVWVVLINVILLILCSICTKQNLITCRLHSVSSSEKQIGGVNLWTNTRNLSHLESHNGIWPLDERNLGSLNAIPSKHYYNIHTFLFSLVGLGSVMPCWRYRCLLYVDLPLGINALQIYNTSEITYFFVYICFVYICTALYLHRTVK